MSGENAHLLVSGRSPAVPAVSIPESKFVWLCTRNLNLPGATFRIQSMASTMGRAFSSVQLGCTASTESGIRSLISP